ncbi:MAG: winged helix-turn-helix transcriptional regulator [Actinomycetota bacterium]|nr:winged helix-turn-helix transcriptional regulator [Actinomycetota bacterium]
MSVEPWAINTQNAACFSINCFFDHTSNTSHQRCCNDRSNSPPACGQLSGNAVDAVSRTEVSIAGVPPKVEYALTPLGASLSETIAGIRGWAYDHMDQIDTARDKYDNRVS